MAWQYDDFVVGRQVRTGLRTVNAEDVAAFAALTGDRHPLHTNPDYAATTTFGQPIAHGLLGLGIAAGLLHAGGVLDEAVVALLGIDDWRFRAPVRPGEAVAVLMTVQAVRPSAQRPHQAIATLDVEVQRDDGVVVQRGALTVLVQRADRGPVDTGPARET